MRGQGEGPIHAALLQKAELVQNAQLLELGERLVLEG